MYLVIISKFITRDESPLIDMWVASSLDDIKLELDCSDSDLKALHRGITSIKELHDALNKPMSIVVIDLE